MRCEDVRQALIHDRYAQTDRSALQEHLGHCLSCGAFAAQQAQLDELLASDADQPPSPGFDARFFARLQDVKTEQITEQQHHAKHSPWARLKALFDLRLAPSRQRLGLALSSLAAAAAAMVVALSPPPEASWTAEQQAIALHLEMLESDIDLLQMLDTLEAIAALDEADTDEI